jgi:hypothetical protein
MLLWLFVFRFLQSKIAEFKEHIPMIKWLRSPGTLFVNIPCQIFPLCTFFPSPNAHPYLIIIIPVFLSFPSVVFPGLRQRHWDQLSAQLAVPGRPTVQIVPDHELTLSQIIQMGLLEHKSVIEEVCTWAVKVWSFVWVCRFTIEFTQ